jgi:hypothetical protein
MNEQKYNVETNIVLKFKILLGFFLNLLDNHNIDRINERNTITRYTTFILGNPYGEENPTKLP